MDTNFELTPTEEAAAPAAIEVPAEQPAEVHTENLEESNQEAAIEVPAEDQDAPIQVEDTDVVIANPKPSRRKVAEPVAVDLEAARAALPEPAGPAVVGNGTVDEVRLGAIIYLNRAAPRSLSVHHMQRRLLELNYGQAGLDKDGFYGKGTATALAAFQEANSLPGEGMINAETLVKLHKDDPNVTVIL